VARLRRRNDRRALAVRAVPEQQPWLNAAIRNPAAQSRNSPAAIDHLDRRYDLAVPVGLAICRCRPDRSGSSTSARPDPRDARCKGHPDRLRRVGARRAPALMGAPCTPPGPPVIATRDASGRPGPTVSSLAERASVWRGRAAVRGAAVHPARRQGEPHAVPADRRSAGRARRPRRHRVDR